MAEDVGRVPQDPPPAAQAGITQALAQAFAAAAALPAEDQEYIAWRIMEKVAEETKWTDSFARSLDVLDRMAAEAKQEHAAGKTLPLEAIL